MTTKPDLAAVAALIADPSRATMLSALLSGQALTAGELARCAKISPQTASTHLGKMVEGSLLSVTQSGRHRYYALRSKQVAQALETLALIAPPQPVRSLNQRLETQALRQARTCYDHLAGALGVLITEALLGKDILRQEAETFEVTTKGVDWFAQMGILCADLHKQRRRFAVACIDWSERRPHIAGALGAAIAHRLFEMQWVIRSGTGRTVKITELGHQRFEAELGIRREDYQCAHI